MTKKQAIAALAERAKIAEKLAERVLIAAREFHNSLHHLWDKENHTAIRAIHAALKDHKRICYSDGDEIEGWSGNCIQQADSIAMSIPRFELMFEDFIESDERA